MFESEHLRGKGDSPTLDVFKGRQGAFPAEMLLLATAQVRDKVPVTRVMRKVNVGDFEVPFGLTYCCQPHQPSAVGYPESIWSSTGAMKFALVAL